MKIVLSFVLGLIALPAILVLAAIAGRLPSNSSANPPGWETSIGFRALDASLEKRAEGLKNPSKPGDPAAIARGSKIYADNCVACHGDAKGPSSWGAKGLYPRAPQFFQQGTDVSPTEAFAAIHDGVRYSGMGAWRDQLDNGQIWDLANFVASLHSRTGTKDVD